MLVVTGEKKARLAREFGISCETAVPVFSSGCKIAPKAQCNLPVKITIFLAHHFLKKASVLECSCQPPLYWFLRTFGAARRGVGSGRILWSSSVVSAGYALLKASGT